MGISTLHSSDYFSRDPQVKIPRSRFDRSHDRKLTFNNGDLIPIYCSEILPGDTVEMDVTSVVRMSTPVKPIMDNIALDKFFFFVPSRLVWTHWEDFMGANRNGHWTPAVEYQIPQLKTNDWGLHTGGFLNGQQWYVPVGISDFFPNGWDGTLSTSPQFQAMADSKYLYYDNSGTYTQVLSTDSWDRTKDYYLYFEGFGPGSLWDYFGLPLGNNSDSVSQLPFRAYCLIWNEFFRDQSYMDPVDYLFSSDADISGRFSPFDDTNVSFYDRITDTVRGWKPLRVSRFHDVFSSGLPQSQFGDPVQIPFSGFAPVNNADMPLFVPRIYGSNGSLISGKHNLGVSPQGGNNGFLSYDSTVDVSSDTFYSAGFKLGADVQSVAGTINDLREAFQVQKYLEKSARSGNLYIEILKAQFGVTNPDYRLQRPEFLGGSREFLNVTQVLQTSSTDSVTPQGNTAAYSLTSSKKHMFVKSFTEHGYLIGLMATRTCRSYQNGINRMWSRKRKLDYFFPVFGSLPETDIKNKELFTHIDSSSSIVSYLDESFAFQERWYEYRYDPDIVCGDFRSNSPQSLDFWHYADFYTSPVYLTEDWLFEGPQNVDRTLAVTSSSSRQFIADIAFKAIYTRPMPIYSIPGFADHF